MSKKKITYPEGAFKSFKEIKKSNVSGPFWLVGPLDDGKMISMKFDQIKRDRRRRPFIPRHRGYDFYRDGKNVGNFWTWASEFAFSYPDYDSFIFNNYWMAYGYMERIKQGD